MLKEDLVKRVDLLQQAVDKSAAEHQQFVANHNALLGRLAEAKFMLETPEEECPAELEVA